MKIEEADKLVIDYENSISSGDTCQIEYAFVILKCQSTTLATMKQVFPIKTHTLDFGNRIRGQGKRMGRMIMGGMFDLSLRGKKSYVDKAEQFNLIGENALDVNLMTTDEWLKYWQARTAGYHHDIATMYAYDDDISFNLK